MIVTKVGKIKSNIKIKDLDIEMLTYYFQGKDLRFDKDISEKEGFYILSPQNPVKTLRERRNTIVPIYTELKNFEVEKYLLRISYPTGLLQLTLNDSSTEMSSPSTTEYHILLEGLLLLSEDQLNQRAEVVSDILNDYYVSAQI